MTDKLKQKIKEELAKLPKDKQETINAVNWATISEEISKKFLLSENETNDLQVQILLVLIGLTDLDDYASNVENEVGTSEDEAKKIADEVIQKIFIPIANIGTEKIKKNVIGKNTSWQQNIDFILSGGDYSSFIAPMRIIEPEKNSPLREHPRSGGGGQISSSPSQGEGSRVRSIHPVASATPQEGNKKISITPTPLSATPTLADIKANMVKKVEENTLPDNKEASIPIKPKDTENTVVKQGL